MSACKVEQDEMSLVRRQNALESTRTTNYLKIEIACANLRHNFTGDAHLSYPHASQQMKPVHVSEIQVAPSLAGLDELIKGVDCGTHAHNLTLVAAVSKSIHLADMGSTCLENGVGATMSGAVNWLTGACFATVSSLVAPR